MQTLKYASCYVYSPRGESAVCGRSRLLCTLLKAGDSHYLWKLARRVHEEATQKQIFGSLFDRRTVLIPVPGSAPPAKGALWVPERLAANLKNEGLGLTVWPGLRRVFPVRKSATAAVGERPSVVDHYDSFAVDRTLVVPEKIVLIDDIVTRGRTLIAAAKRLQEAFPEAQIQAFAMLRTMGLALTVERLLEPCRGEIECRGRDAWRNP